MTLKTDQDVYALHNDEDFLQRLVIGVVSLAHDIITEGDTTPNHERRLVWARKAVADPRNVATGMVWAALGNPTLQGKAAAADTMTSEEIKATVAAVVASLVVPVSVSADEVPTKPE